MGPRKAAAGDITVDAPAAGAAITSPVTVTGTALTFEGNVAVEVRRDRSRQPLGTGFVTGGGDVARPFAGEIDFSTATEPCEAILFLDHSAEDGRLWQASVTRVAFGCGRPLAPSAGTWASGPRRRDHRW